MNTTLPISNRFSNLIKLFVVTVGLSLSVILMTAQTTRPIGVNLSDIGPWSSQLMFVDAMKQSSSWMAQHTDFSDFAVDSVNGVAVQIPLRDDGYPTHAPFAVNGDTLQPHVMMLADQPAPWYYPSGDYTFQFSGTGPGGYSLGCSASALGFCGKPLYLTVFT